MPIRNLTTNVKAAFPNIGTIRKGGPKSPNKPGVDLAGFRFTSERPEVLAAFEEVYGAEPKVLSVFLPHAAVDDCFSAWQEEWTAGSLLHRCDGETMVLWQTPAGMYSTEPKACPYFTGEKARDKAKRPGCKAVGRLTLILPELVRAGYVGYVLLATTSKHDIMSITASLLDAAEKRAGHPHGLRGIDWTLRRQSERISTPGDDGKRVRRPKSLVKIEPSSIWVQAQLASAQAEALGQLPAPSGIGHVDRGTGEIIAPPPDENGDDDEIVESTATEVAPSTAAPVETKATAPTPAPTDWQAKMAAWLELNGMDKRVAAKCLRLWALKGLTDGRELTKKGKEALSACRIDAAQFEADLNSMIAGWEAEAAGAEADGVEQQAALV